MKCILIVFILMEFTFKCYCQQPGGNNINGPQIWLISSKSVDGKYQWTSNNGYNNIIFSTTVLNSGESINFNNAVKYSGNPFSIIISDLKPVTLISAFYPNFSSVSSSHLSSDSFFSIKFNGNKILQNNYNLIANEKQAIVNNNYPFKISSEDEWNKAMKVYACYFTSLPTDDVNNPAGINQETKLTMNINGYCPEILIYSTELSDSAIWKVETYFAIKYGLTLDYSYLGTDDKILWDVNKRKDFHNRVCAIGIDKSGAVRQPFSNSSYEEIDDYCSFKNPSDSNRRSVTFGFSVNAFNQLPDKEFLFWGDDNGNVNSKDMVEIDTVKFKGLEVVKRKWIMQNDVNISQPTTVGIAGNLFNELEKKNNQCYFLVKRNGKLKSVDIYPLDSNAKKMTEYYGNNIHWNNSIDSFTFGRCEELKLETLKCDKGGDWKIWAGANEYLYGREKKLGVRVGSPDRVIGYKYRTANSNRTGDCGAVPVLSKGSLEFYFSGGIGPYQYQIDNGPFNNLSYKKDGEINIATILGLATGDHLILVKDMTRQTISLKKIKI